MNIQSMVVTIFLLIGFCTANLVHNVEAAGHKEAKVKQADLLPPYSKKLRGNHEVRIRNPNTFTVKAGIRSGKLGRDIDVPARGVKSAFVPNGNYDIFFVYSDKPNALFQGDPFTIDNNGVEIQIVQVVNGNYSVHQVK